MHAAVRADHIAHLPDLEAVRRILEWLLHLPAREPAEVSTVRVRRAVGMRLSELSKLVGVAADLGLVAAQDFDRLFFRAGDGRLRGRRWIARSGKTRQLSQRRVNSSTRTSFQLDGRRLSRCFTNRWLARTLLGSPPPPVRY